MTIKLLFHALAIISGIIAGGCALLSSKNRIVLFIVFSLIAAIFELAIPFLKTSLDEPPEISYSLKPFFTKYAPGIEVDGIVWRHGFQEYFLEVQNKSKIAEVHDLRLDIDMPGGVIKYKLMSSEGCEDITIYQENKFHGFGIASRKSHVISKTVNGYSNNLKINAVKLFPKSKFILKVIFDATYGKGYFGTKFRYLNTSNTMTEKSKEFYIVAKEDNKNYFIDIVNPIVGEHIRSFGITLDKPLIFGQDGSVKEGQPPK